ncbi:septal ring lytic transglycosylase RlpA family protein [Paraburkholderia sp. Ac-20342]|uniref:septal ring lytic transglycosylase RlpA family protein n=1 Tax=Paraburkholderia sp. Ac-20342 TaxID=2703889 RepID=UPI00197D1828|nr:septal ring lytic transglycosylase RlpA family protein [Paraburkholderia sp. Ac-20342]MBN3847068.1 septal ring lytic transglycosylase RlpA family protein [Paraburkholderia sp. Ac-20342]
MRLDIVFARLMKTRLSRGLGTLFAFFVLAGCATPPGAGDTSASDTPISTQTARLTTLGPQSFGSAPASSPSAASTPLADARPLGDDGVDASSFRQTGRASWYGRFFHGRRTANGERYDMHALTAAHRTLPLGSYVRVTNPANSRSVVVRINDRGPYARGRVIDLSMAAASALDMRHSGTARVQIVGLTQQEARAEMNETLASDSDSDASK